ncbi:hypothetical protein GCK72_020876 [Caenorhabditis remanei]|uniref:Serpentine receptor class gamma n=1 Tax=Caenorhabditis remanei TaxID=31234 RepID=A0A6A5GI07_CAERE|nr:hypothetical protein GCK72_020876 [Caenorhabditis remanei]KAF1754316.1 hypothetical protein GCK72_020876 [Caenorhabditis remanei]
MTINILCYLNTWISRLYHIETTIPFMIWVHDNAYFVFRVYRFFVNYYHSAQSLSVIIMAAHRFWSSKSTSSNRFWSMYYGHVYLGLAVTSGILTMPNVFLGLYAVDYYDREAGVFVINRLTANTRIIMIADAYNQPDEHVAGESVRNAETRNNGQVEKRVYSAVVEYCDFAQKLYDMWKTFLVATVIGQVNPEPTAMSERV